MTQSSKDAFNWLTNLVDKFSNKTEINEIPSNFTDKTIECILTVIHTNQYGQLLPLCQHLFNSLKEDSENALKKELSHLLPALLHAYVRLSRLVVYGDATFTLHTDDLSSLKATKNSHSNKKQLSIQQGCLEKLQALLLSIYNICVVSMFSSSNSQLNGGGSTGSGGGNVKLTSCCFVPGSQDDSIYHKSWENDEMIQLSPNILLTKSPNSSVNLLQQQQQQQQQQPDCHNNMTFCKENHYPIYETVTSHNMWIIFTGLLHLYHVHLNTYSTISQQSYCELTRFISQLHDTIDPTSSTGLIQSHRLPFVEETFLIELCCGLYYFMYNCDTSNGTQAVQTALQAIELRATFEAMSSVLLIINSIRNNSCERLIGGVKQLTSETISTTTTSIVNNNKQFLITNATFSPEKLPDDIAPLVNDTNNTSSPHPPSSSTAAVAASSSSSLSVFQTSNSSSTA